MPDLIAACSWSSGKDSCLALYRSIQSGLDIKYLVNFISYEHGRVSFHGTKRELVDLQSQVLGIPLLQRETTRKNYEEVFRKTLRELRERNIRQIVRGDIHLIDLQDWVENICSSEGIKVISPLWNNPTEDLLKEFIQRGFKAVVTSVQANKINADWIGKTIDRDFVEYVKSLKDIDLCGENGEYHSFVYDGPIYKKRIKIMQSDKVFRENYWFLDIQRYMIE